MIGIDPYTLVLGNMATEIQLIWKFESMIFKAKHFVRERSLHTDST